MDTIADALTTDLSDWLTAQSLHADLNVWPEMHEGTASGRTLPALVIGHENLERHPGMSGTATIGAFAALITDLDESTWTADTHRTLAGLIETTLRGIETKPGPLTNSYLHALYLEEPLTRTEDRRQVTAIKFNALTTLQIPD